jgi:oligoendopeptidase F
MELTRTPDVEIPSFRFVPEGFHPTDTEALKALYTQLKDREPGSPEELRGWLYDRSELSSVVGGEYARCFTAMNRDTKNEDYKERTLAYQKDVLPLAGQLDNELEEKLLASPHVDALGPAFDVLLRDARLAVKIFRKENTELTAEDRALGAKYSELQGNSLVDLGGEQLTVQQAAAKLADTDRSVREEAFVAIGKSQLENVTAVDEIFDALIDIRQKKAKNAGFDNYRDFRFAEMARFDYTPVDCEKFQDAVEKVVVPAVREASEYRRERLAVDTLRPYDRDVSIFQRPLKKIFETQEEYVDLLQRIFRSIDPLFERDFDILVRNGLLDLMSRPGKAPGGYNCGVDDMRLPFIFYNAVGRRDDLRVMLHEGGHAFHTLAARGMPVGAYRHAPTEFCEVASMAMEMFGNERLREVMSEEDAKEIEYGQMEGALGVFCSVARVDGFQQWLYSAGHPGPDERNAKWVELSDRFSPGLTDWSGFEDIQLTQWQRIPHFFGHPFYYIEYGIAQLGALQMWHKEKLDHDGTIAGYREALALGGSRPLRDLFARAGIRFAMDEEIMQQVIPAVVARMKELRTSS